MGGLLRAVEEMSRELPKLNGTWLDVEISNVFIMFLLVGKSIPLM